MPTSHSEAVPHLIPGCMMLVLGYWAVPHSLSGQLGWSLATNSAENSLPAPKSTKLYPPTEKIEDSTLPSMSTTPEEASGDQVCTVTDLQTTPTSKPKLCSQHINKSVPLVAGGTLDPAKIIFKKPKDSMKSVEVAQKPQE